MDLNNLLVIDGGTVKTEKEGIVTGMGIVFGSENDPDQSNMRDFFTSDSFVMKKHTFSVPLYYDHGLGPITDQIGEATLTKTATGWEAVAEIDVSSEVGQKVYEVVKEKPHGFSSGALQHLVKREAKSNNTNFLKKWVVGELSLTERPAERKAVVQSIKSVDGEVFTEDAWKPMVEVYFYDEAGNVVFDGKEGSFENAKTVEVKSAGGSQSFNLWFEDPNTDKEYSVSVYEYGGVEDLITRLQNILNTASMAVKSESEGGSDDTLEQKITSIVEGILNAKTSDTDVPDNELTDQLKAKDEELADLRIKLSDRDEALTIATEKIAQLEILAGAKKTIDNFIEGK